MTRLTEEEYVEQGGLACPSCGSTEGPHDGGLPEYYTGGMNQDEKCYECGATWTSVYKLEGYEEAKGGNF